MTLDWFSVYAPIYDPFVSFFRIAPAGPLLEWLKPEPHERLLDIGGGTGRVARLAAPSTRETIVLDPCAAMLGRIPPFPNLRGVKGRAQELPFEDQSFDMVLCVDALHHIKDAEAAAREIYRVLRPGGRVLVQEFDVRGLRGMVVGAFERLFVDQSRFFDPGALARLFASAGLPGRWERRSWLEYAFMGARAES